MSLVDRVVLSISRTALLPSESGRGGRAPVYIDRIFREIGERSAGMISPNVWVARTTLDPGLCLDLGTHRPPVLEVRRYSFGVTSCWIRVVSNKRWRLDDLAETWAELAGTLLREIDHRLEGAYASSRPFSSIHVVRGSGMNGAPPDVIYKLTFPLVRGRINPKYAEEALFRPTMRRAGDLVAISECGVFIYLSGLSEPRHKASRRRIRRRTEYAVDLALAQLIMMDNPWAVSLSGAVDQKIVLADPRLFGSIRLAGGSFFSFIFRRLAERLNLLEKFEERGGNLISVAAGVDPPRFLRGLAARAMLGLEERDYLPPPYVYDDRKVRVLVLVAAKSVLDDMGVGPRESAVALHGLVSLWNVKPKLSPGELERKISDRIPPDGLSVPEISGLLGVDESLLYPRTGGLMRDLLAGDFVEERTAKRTGRGRGETTIYLPGPHGFMRGLKKIVRPVIALRARR